MVIAAPITYFYYRVETADLSIVLSAEHNFNVTINKRTKLALDVKRLIDDGGKERKFRAVSKAAKTWQ